MLAVSVLERGCAVGFLLTVGVWGNREYLLYQILLTLKRYGYWCKADMIRFSEKQWPEEVSC